MAQENYVAIRFVRENIQYRRSIANLSHVKNVPGCTFSIYNKHWIVYSSKLKEFAAPYVPTFCVTPFCSFSWYNPSWAQDKN